MTDGLNTFCGICFLWPPSPPQSTGQFDGSKHRTCLPLNNNIIYDERVREIYAAVDKHKTHIAWCSFETIPLIRCLQIAICTQKNSLFSSFFMLHWKECNACAIMKWNFPWMNRVIDDCHLLLAIPFATIELFGWIDIYNPQVQGMTCPYFCGRKARTPREFRPLLPSTANNCDW